MAAGRATSIKTTYDIKRPTTNDLGAFGVSWEEIVVSTAMSMTVKSELDSVQGIRRRIRDAMAASGVAEAYNDRTGELTDNARVVLQRRYLSKDREGNVLEDPDGNVPPGGPQPFPVGFGVRGHRNGTDRLRGTILRSDAPAGVPAQLAHADERRPGTATAFGLLRAAR